MELIDQTRENLITYTCSQISTFFPGMSGTVLRRLISRNCNEALNRLEHCINSVRMWKSDQFNYLNSSQYCQYVYFLSNTIWHNEDGSDGIAVATRLFLLNKALNGIDLFYEIEMPPVFFIGHSVGIVLAKASYGNYFVLYQNSTVGKNHGIAPVMGDGVVMYPNTAIIGRCHIGPGTIVSQGTSIINRDCPGDRMVYTGSDGNLVFKPAKRAVLEDIFRI